MDYVLTESSTAHCGHPTPPALLGGAVTLKATQTVLTVGSAAVLTGTLTGATIDKLACVQQNTPATPSNNPCDSVVTLDDGISKVLKVNGTPVLLASAKGTTDGLPLFDWKADAANQSVLRAD